MKYLKTLMKSDSTKIASLGWCFGGGQPLQLALNTSSHDPLAAIIIYYESLVTYQNILSNIKWLILGIFGSLDQSLSVSKVQSFQKAPNNITNDIYIYEGVGHAFANQTGGSFAPAELIDAWEKNINFLNENVKEK